MSVKVINKHLNASDVEVFGKHIPNDRRNAGYNIGDLLNMPHLANVWFADPHNNLQELQRMYVIGENYKDSIMHYYIQRRPSDELIPCIPRIVGATKLYTDRVFEEHKELFQMVQSDDTLCVHVRSGDNIVDSFYICHILTLAKKFKNIFLFSGVHLDEYFKTNEEKKENFVNSINSILEHNHNIHIVLCEPDMHVSLMSKAKHLLLHKGGFSTIGSIVCEGNIYSTMLFNTIFQENWIKYVNKKIIML